MRILIVNTSEKVGGAAIAANRLMEALKKHGVSVRMLVRDRQTSSMSVVQVETGLMQAVRFAWERFVIFVSNRFHRHNLFAVDIANTGYDITKMKDFEQADVIHLHWVNQGFLSLNDLDRILHSGKKIVVTLHDMWYFTGICHYSGDCGKYQDKCNGCPMIYHSGDGKDLSYKVFSRKQRMYEDADITFVGCSKWIAGLAKSSALAKNQRVVSIPNAINTDVFKPMDKTEARKKCKLPVDKKLLLFGSQRITDERKGFKYLAEACEIIKKKYPDVAEKMGLVVVGGKSETIQSEVVIPVYSVDYVSNEKDMVAIYNASDIYVTPSLQDNLPNTIVESMACGIPCVGFNIGGIPEMIDHKQNGYVAEYQNADDFANGILWTLDDSRHKQLSVSAYDKAISTYSESSVAEQYCKIYNNDK